MRWRIYYADREPFSDRDGSPFYAPQVDVQAVVVENPKGEPAFFVWQGRDVYCWKDDRWNPSDVPGLYDYLMLYKGPKAVLFGRNVRDDLYWAAVGRASKEGLG